MSHVCELYFQTKYDLMICLLTHTAQNLLGSRTKQDHLFAQRTIGSLPVMDVGTWRWWRWYGEDSGFAVRTRSAGARVEFLRVQVTTEVVNR